MSLSTHIIYGTAWKKEQTASLVVKAVLNGFRAVDTGATLDIITVGQKKLTLLIPAGQLKHYREDLVGVALKELEQHNIKREDLFLQTKYTPVGGQDLTRSIPYMLSEPIAEQVLSSCQNSLTNLRTNYLDSYILHSPLPSLEQTLEAWQALAQLQDEGKVRLIGVSNTYDVKILAALDRVRKVQVVQNRWYEGNNWDQKVFNYCKENEIMYQSFWTLTGSPSFLTHPATLQLATASNLTPPQVVYKFAQSQGIIPLSGTKSEQHMQEDVAVEKSPLEGDGVQHLLKVIRAFVTG